ncbi:MAG: DUF4402 domain-containing protein [Alphaproteobacteria bacterium]|nr:DUF4402 domain-containing protein [Alphaproteobacteria bacterium]
MKKLLLITIITLLRSTAVDAATATGDAHVNMITSLSLSEEQSVDFGDVAMDGPGIVTMQPNGTVLCPSAYLCPGPVMVGQFTVTGKPSEVVEIQVDESAMLSALYGKGVSAPYNMAPFTPILSDSSVELDLNGEATFTVGGSVELDGSEQAGEFSTTKSYGAPYQLSVIYP